MSPGYPALRQVDVHTHAMPRPLLGWLAERGLADLAGLADGVVDLDPVLTGGSTRTTLSCPAPAYDVGPRLAAMDEAGVEVQAVAVSPHLRAAASGDTALVLELTRRSNEALAAFVAEAPDHLVALATVPVGLPEAAEEVRYCLDELGMAGVSLGTHGAGRDLTDPVHTPLWQVLAERRVFALLHPVGGPGDLGDSGEPWAGSVTAAVDIALAVAGLLRAGTLETYDFPLCLTYGGGALPAVRGMMQRGWERLGEGPALRHSPSTSCAGSTTTPRPSTPSHSSSWSSSPDRPGC
ncbi:amidohydrolase family protein [Raineyella fluvialis]|uniref:Amidohydrolase family protein n=1 Tax=Raineyella fluvialis TaxID=2662261 RepID=A0A5Q2F7S8_9ACTN|nr:amidohydrolase family protein [Raineyella fluvialis]QGF22972.1 amidohydrolase family protein [Raineyella fluvialis]